MNKPYGVIVVGGGHAGVEAALAAARMQVPTLLITHNIETIGQMSCNPAIGGIGKGHLVKEIDALGGVMARAADAAGIQFRTLNQRKGAAVRATRAQSDRALYRAYIRRVVEHAEHLDLFQQGVDDLILEGERVVGVVTETGICFYARAVVLTTGTFLAGRIHVGDQAYSAGRAGDKASVKLADRLRELALPTGRLKTGTPPRIDSKSVDFSKLGVQPGDEPRPLFSYLSTHRDHPRQVPCHIAHTNAKTHDIIRGALDKSAMYGGHLEGAGPRYCPSIEDKIVRFAEREVHQVFIEPEGLEACELYPNGISTSLPYAVQVAMVQSMVGFEAARIVRPGYAIAYDFYDPKHLAATLEVEAIKGLFFAGQINGTTGYEEAAAQGLLAGANAALQYQERAPWVVARSEAYMGVMVDDLITMGAPEPYRMFTSRAEHRLMLREDNADARLTVKGRELGLVGDARWQQFRAAQAWLAKGRAALTTYLKPHEAHLKTLLLQSDGAVDVVEGYCADAGIGTNDAGAEWPAECFARLYRELHSEVKYAGYIDRQTTAIAREARQAHWAIPSDLDIAAITGLSHEAQTLLTHHRPKTVAQAKRLPGMTPTAISLLMVHLKRRGKAAA